MPVPERQIDWDRVLASLQGRKKLLVELIEIFLGEHPQMMRKISQAIAAGDGRNLQVHAHGLKGGLRYFGDSTAASIAADLETAARNNNLTNADSDTRRLAEAIEALLPELQQFVDDNRP